MPSQHRTTPLSIRLPDAERRRLYDYAERRGLPVRRVILDAIREKLDRDELRDASGEFSAPRAPDVHGRLADN